MDSIEFTYANDVAFFFIKSQFFSIASFFAIDGSLYIDDTKHIPYMPYVLEHIYNDIKHHNITIHVSDPSAAESR